MSITNSLHKIQDHMLTFAAGHPMRRDAKHG